MNQKCSARDLTSSGTFKCDREDGHYPESQHATLGLGGRVVWMWEDADADYFDSLEASMARHPAGRAL